MEFQKRNLEMSRNVLNTLSDRCLIIDEADGLKKLTDSDWLPKQEHSHIAYVLRRLIDITWIAQCLQNAVITAQLRNFQVGHNLQSDLRIRLLKILDFLRAPVSRSQCR